ncbi:MAG: glycerophosphodiester phosphodiesterase family protein [Candidatus Saccharimonas sp.]
MLVIGHRGAAGLAPENTLEAIAAGIDTGADMIEIDVRLTKDHKLVVIHDARLLRTHHLRDNVANLTYDELAKLTLDQPIPLLSEVLDLYYGTVMLNIELKSRGAGEKLVQLLKRRYVKKAADWDNLIISSFMGYELVRIRRLAKRANLALLHNENPFIFVAYHRFVRLTAVGFHRLYLNRFAIEIAKQSNLFIYAYTVDRPGALSHLAAQGIEGIVTNYPDKIIDAIEQQTDRPSSKS